MMDNIARLREKLPEGTDAFLICASCNRFYFTGFRSSAGALVVSRKGAWLFMDSRYFEAASMVVQGCELILMTRLRQQLAELFEKEKISTVEPDTAYMSVAELEGFRTAIPNCTFLTTGTLDREVVRMRMCKTADEVARMKEAQRLTDDAFTYILTRIQPGKTEMELALDLEFYVRNQGADGAAFQFIFISGEKTSLPHGVPGNRVLQKGDFITMDYGALVGGYCADMTRTVALGEPSEEMRRVYDIVLRANLAGLEAAGPGKNCFDVDKVSRDLITQEGYGEYFGHGLGHSVGLEIHEEPRCSPSCREILEPGMIMTIEPGIYLPGQFGVRIEDMILITETGIENLTHSPKELIIL